MEITEMIQLINDKLTTKKKLAKELNMKDTELTAMFKEHGYEYNFIEKLYLKNPTINNEVAVTVENEGSKDGRNNSSNDGSKESSDDSSEVESNDDIDNSSIDDLFDSIEEEKPEFVALNTHVRKDISEALAKYAKGKKRGAKQELINGLLELALKRKGYL